MNNNNDLNNNSDLWYKNLVKSPLTPPDYIFPIVWTILYIMITISGYNFIKNNPTDTYGISIFFLQLFFNIMWSYLFFYLKNPKLAFIDLILLRITLLLTIIHFYTKDRFSADMLIPYFIWVFFAGYLNLFIVINN
jgi:benzodiazapine receptor